MSSSIYRHEARITVATDDFSKPRWTVCHSQDPFPTVLQVDDGDGSAVSIDIRWVELHDPKIEDLKPAINS